MPEIRCACGEHVLVNEVQAGTRVRCECGREIEVPPLTVLQRGADEVAERADWADTAEREFLFLFTNQENLPHRISNESLFHFVAACERVATTYLATLDMLDQSLGVDIQIGCALLPRGETLVDIQIRPDVVPTEALRELCGELQQLAAPPVEGGPVAFAIRRMLWGGSAEPYEFDLPFARQILPSGEFREILMDGAGSWSHEPPQREVPARSWWQHLRSLLFRHRGRDDSPPSMQPVDAPDPEVESHGLVARRARCCTTPADVEALFQQFPECGLLFQRLGDLWIEKGKYDQAIEAYNGFIRLEPGNAIAYASRAHAHCLGGNMQRGLADYTTALELDPRQIGCLAARGAIFLELGAWSRAETDFSTAIQCEPHHPGLYVERARSRYLQDHVEQALADLDAALRLDPHHETAYALRGTARQQLPGATALDIQNAVRDFSNALDISPDKAWYHAQRAEAYTTQNKFTLAIADCDRAIELDNQCDLAFGVRGFANQQLENYTEAISDCSEAIKLGLQTVAVYMSRASAFGVQGDFERAISDCDAALDLVPDFAPAFNLRGTLRLAQGDPESASQDFADACRLAPNWATPYGHRANAHRVQAEHELAIEEYTRAIELEPHNLMALVNRALTWMDLENLDKATQDLNEAIRIDADFAAGYFHRAELCLRQDEFDRALEDLDRAIGLQANFAPAFFIRAQVLLHQQMNELALRDYDTLIRLNPTLPAAFIGRANVWIHIGDQEKASDDYREAVNLDPSSAEEFHAARLLAEAQCMHQQQNYPDAIAKATEAIERDPENSAAYAARALSYWYSEQSVEAADDYSRLLELTPDAGYAYCGRGQAYAEMGEYEDALSDLNKAIQLANQTKSKLSLAYSLNGRGLAYAGMQRFEEAAVDFEQSIQLCPQNAWVHYNRGLMYQTMGNLDQARDSLQSALEMDDPPLTQRKRDRVKAFLDTQ